VPISSKASKSETNSSTQTTVQPWPEMVRGQTLGPVIKFLDCCCMNWEYELGRNAQIGNSVHTFVVVTLIFNRSWNDNGNIFSCNFLRIFPCFPGSTSIVSPGYSQPGGCPHPRRRPAVPHRLALQFQSRAQLQKCWTGKIVKMAFTWVPISRWW